MTNKPDEKIEDVIANESMWTTMAWCGGALAAVAAIGYYVAA